MSKLGYLPRIKLRVAELERMIQSAQAELDDLKVAERVLSAFSVSTDEKGPDDGQSRTSTASGSTVADVAVNLLSIEGPMDTMLLLNRMQETWRPDLKQTTLASTLSRIKGDGRITSFDGKWRVSSNTEEPHNSGPSLIGEDVRASDTDDDEGRSLI
jgi:hypothetical protein